MDAQVPQGARRAIRRAVELDCELVCPHHDEPLAYRIGDLSPHGAWIPTLEPVRTGEQVVLCFEPDAGWRRGPLMVFAEVARVATARRARAGDPGVGMALELLDLQADEEGELRAWLAGRRSPRPRRRRPVSPSSLAAIAPAVAMPPRGARCAPQAYRALGSCWR